MKLSRILLRELQLKIYEGITTCREVHADPESSIFGEHHCVILTIYYDE